MMRPGTGVTSLMGRNTVWSTPTGTTVIRSGATLICAAMSRREFCDTVTTAGSARATRTCMRRNPNQRRVGEVLPGVRRVRERQLAVDGDGVVQGGQQGPPVLDHAQHAVAQALVVVDDVEFVPALGQELAGPQRVGQRLAEAGRAHDAELDPVLPGGELAPVGHPERVGIPVQVEPGHRGEADALVEFGPGRTGEHLDRVAQGAQLPRQVAGVDPLAPTARIAPVGQVGDAHAAGPRRGGGDGGGHLNMARALPGLLGFNPLLTGGFWQGDVPDSALGGRLASPNALVLRKRRRLWRVRLPAGGGRGRVAAPGRATPAATEVVVRGSAADPGRPAPGR